jgi:uncharacterized protein (TIGR02453 family)
VNVGAGYSAAPVVRELPAVVWTACLDLTIVWRVGFRGWTAEAIDFYDGLEEDNSKTYWQAHKATYEQAVRHPMEELLAELADQCGPGRIFRPNRDVRFSADKSPYKTAIGATLDNGGYIQLSAAGLAAGRGMYTMAADQLQRYREAAAADPSGLDLARTAAGVRGAGIELTAHDRLKTAPKGYPRDHPRLDLLCLKGLVAWKQWPAAAWLATPKPKARVTEFFLQTDPLQDWLTAHVGPSTVVVE